MNGVVRDVVTGTLTPPSGTAWPDSALTTEEVVDDGVGSTVGINQPVGEGEPGVDSLPVI